MLERKKEGVVFKDSTGKTTEVKLSDLPADIVQKLAVYGLYTKLSKARAGKQNPDEAVYQTISALKEGRWTVVGNSKVSPTVRASFETLKTTLATMKDRNVKKQILSSMKDQIKKMPEEMQTALMQIAQIPEKEFKSLLSS